MTPRRVVRTAQLDEALRDQFVAAFGTVWNAYRQLGLASLSSASTPSAGQAVSFSTFARACRLLPISPEDLTAITTAWNIRRREPVAP